MEEGLAVVQHQYDIEALLEEGFCLGSILNVTMHNFLTYRGHCSFPVGPRLNVVVGPNGSGKSAMTHAICLACAGTPRDVGRSKDLKSFVSIGRPEHEETFVEIDLMTHDLGIATVRRTINADANSSKWQLNGANTTERNVKAFMKGQNIDVDNLCTFMPQDRVGSFSSMSPKEKFAETLRSIDESLARKQRELADAESSREEFRKDRDALRREYTTLKDQLLGMEQELQRLQRRELCQEELLDYELVKMYKEREMLVVLLKEKQEALEVARNRLNEEQDKIVPLEQRERQLRMKQAEREKMAGNAIKRQRELDQMLLRKRNAMEDAVDEVTAAANAISTHARGRVKKELELEKLQEEKRLKDAELRDSQAALPAIQEQLEEVRRGIDTLMQRVAQLNDETAKNSSESHQINEELIRTNRDCSNLQDRRQCYMEMLQRSHDPMAQEAAKAMQYLQSQEAALRERGALHGSVIGPVAFHCDVKDAACAAMVERCVPKNRLLSFIVSNNHDAKALRDIFKNVLHIKTDIITMSNPVISNDQPYSTSHLAQLSGLNLKYLRDEVECPDVIRSFLYTFQSLHQTVWGRTSRLPSDEELSHLCPPGIKNFKLFVHLVPTGGNATSSNDIQEFTGRVSKYRSGPPSMSSGAVQPSTYIRGTGSQDADVAQRRADLERAADGFRQTLQQKSIRAAQLAQQQQRTYQEINGLKGKRTELVACIKIPKDCQNVVDSLAKKISSINAILSQNADEEYSQKVDCYERAVEDQLQRVKAVIDAGCNCNKFAAEAAVTEGLKRVLSDELANVRNELEDARRERAAFELAVAKAEQIKMSAENAKKQLDNEFKEKMSNSMERKKHSDQNEFKAYLRELIRRLPEKTPDAIEGKLMNLQAEIDSIMDNQGIKDRYDEVFARAEQVRVDAEKADEQYQNAETNLTDGVDKWKNQIIKICLKMNMKFADFMGRLGLRGELHLREVGRIDDYEIDIKVSFRNEMDLASLSAHRHSGGERSVTTVMYLMALQGMSQSPFRVLDEINQGMDEINERLVLDRIVAECCSEQTSAQYFLVTPKLLQALISLDNDRVTLLLVQNGPGIRGTQFTFKNLVNDMEQRCRSSEHPRLVSSGPDTDDDDTNISATKRKRTATATAAGRTGKKNRTG